MPGMPSFQRPGTQTATVPGDPVGLLACRYDGHGQVQPFGSFAAASSLSPKIVARGLNGDLSVPMPDPFARTSWTAEFDALGSDTLPNSVP